MNEIRLNQEAVDEILARFDWTTAGWPVDSLTHRAVRDVLSVILALLVNEETDEEIAMRKWDEYMEYMSEWNGDYPDEREHMTFQRWLDKDNK